MTEKYRQPVNHGNVSRSFSVKVHVITYNFCLFVCSFVVVVFVVAAAAVAVVVVFCVVVVVVVKCPIGTFPIFRVVVNLL